MLVKEVFRIIDSINENYIELKKDIFGEAIVKNGILGNINDIEQEVTQLENNFEALNNDVSDAINRIDDSFLNEFEVRSFRLENSLIEPELSIIKIANHIHNLENSFEIFIGSYLEIYELSSDAKALASFISKQINTLISVLNVSEKSDSFSFSKAQKKLVTASMNIIEGELKLKLNEYNKQTDKLFKSHQSAINGLEAAAERGFKELHLKTETIREVFDSTLKDLNAKSVQMDELLEQSANRTMAQDYDYSAADEKKAANWLRLGSLACMGIIIYIVCYSFYDSTHSGFDWESSIFRTVLVFILSIPAAYLSRESTKHREQQYNYHHTALDLKAITPYIASLPEADQNRIKISIAERIFASRQTNLNQQDSFPLNTQELMMELIKKVDIRDKLKNEDKPVQKS
ncbi:hypothetical protein HJP15_19005 [Pseudoalteromonas sp. NEC-BIFX-2020_002]|uniref:hypothetical protein n=1 Tax=Pseudoalteromonas sp. NEC-BIFX-2020_002 TaxID=2732353 RepID=UPI00147683A9|nr:hypothetical protein [Pseudoalteromonas sp. NEC-BIFX-2020_002]NNG44981.1 hypothetical protein [Pseudoalteromonas sp. NEC-BIFX-2020_002]